MYDFPEEIWYEILQNLPSKSLCRFLCVCKAWNRLIKSQAFISSNLNQNIRAKRNGHMLLRFADITDGPNYKNEEFLFYPHYQTDKIVVPSCKLEAPTGRRFYATIGSCNGLVCMADCVNIILWNPSIHKFVKLLPSSSHEGQTRRLVLGFGVNLLDGEFKVIKVIPNVRSPLAEVYSLRTGKWVEVNGFSLKILWLRQSQVNLNGRVHWIGMLVFDKECSIISFDMSKKVFHVDLLPKQFDNKVYDLRIMSLKGKECLAIVTDGAYDQTERSHVWVMKEYGVLDSWTHIYTIDLMGKCLRFIGFTNDSNILMIKEKQLTCYDPLTKLDSKFDVICLPNRGSGWQVEQYVESLVLIEPCFNNVQAVTTSCSI